VAHGITIRVQNGDAPVKSLVHFRCRNEVLGAERQPDLTNRPLNTLRTNYLRWDVITWG
jgi:hypothetical protein